MKGVNVRMGLRSKLNKMKSFLFDEEDEEKEVKKISKKPLRKESKKSEIKSLDEDLSKTQEIEELYIEDDSEPKLDETKEVKSTEIKSRVLKSEAEFKFPEFSDDDFMVAKPKPEPIINPVKQEPKRVLYQGSKRKEETKKFKPSPIISPIYGLLDEEGNRIKSGSSKTEKIGQEDEISLDMVRKKAYGNLDEELEDTMKRLSKKTIEEAEKDMEKEEKELSRTKQKKREVKEEKPVVISSDDSDDDDDMILPNINFKEIDVDKEREKVAKAQKKQPVDEQRTPDDLDDDEDTKEQDLFNLIDSMYQKEGKGE